MTATIQQLGRRAALMEKEASSRLRALIKLIRINNPSGPSQAWILKLLGKSIGQVQSRILPTGEMRVIQSSIAQPYQGMGLGKKMLGDLFRSLPPGQKFYPGTSLTPQNVRLWESMRRRSGKAPWEITKGKDFRSHFYPSPRAVEEGTQIVGDKLYTMTRSGKQGLRGTPVETISPETMDKFREIAGRHLTYPGNQMGY